VFTLLARPTRPKRLEVLAPLRLSLAKVGVLHHLAAAGEPVPLSALAEVQKCVRSNITQLVDRLEKDGLVRRRGDPEDRRSVRAALTAAGERLLARANQVLATEQASIIGTLSAGHVANLKGALELLAPKP
jgi:DNA-binding MarR family transcriptional regulator